MSATAGVANQNFVQYPNTVILDEEQYLLIQKKADAYEQKDRDWKIVSDGTVTLSESAYNALQHQISEKQLELNVAGVLYQVETEKNKAIIDAVTELKKEIVHMNEINKETLLALNQANAISGIYKNLIAIGLETAAVSHFGPAAPAAWGWIHIGSLGCFLRSSFSHVNSYFSSTPQQIKA